MIAGLDQRLDEFQALVMGAKDAEEPDSLPDIRALRPGWPQKVDRAPAIEDFKAARLKGAFYGRMAGCTLGAALEFQSVNAMKDWAEHFGDAYPLRDYWSSDQGPDRAALPRRQEDRPDPRPHGRRSTG